MKNLKTFEQWNPSEFQDDNTPKKKFGEFYSISDLHQGEEINYAGGHYYVIVPGDASIVIHKEENGDPSTGIEINQAMFTERGSM